MGVKAAVLNAIAVTPGLTARQITTLLYGEGANQSPILVLCKTLEMEGQIKRVKRCDGRTGNYINAENSQSVLHDEAFSLEDDALSEDDLNKALLQFLNDAGWSASSSYGKYHGREMTAKKGNKTWIIVISVVGAYMSIRTKHFNVALGELLLSMDDVNAKYSVVLPKTKEFLRMWMKLPNLAKKKTGITAIFIDVKGYVEEVH